ncbi:unnamed protein product, partial [Prunus brigantina]
MVLCSKCNCEAELEIVLPKQKQPTPSVFDRIGTTSHNRTRQNNYPRPVRPSKKATEQPKEEISIKIPGDEKPLAAIIEGRWYSNIAPILPETNSAAKGKEPEKLPQAEQAVFHSQKMLKTKSPDKPRVHLTSSPHKQPEVSQTEAFGAELEGLLQGDLGINTVFILSEKFWAAEGQESTLEGDVFSQESFECRLAEAEETSEQQADSPTAGRTANKSTTDQLCFSKPTKEMANHLRPLFITANFGGIPVPKVMVDGGAAINLLPHRMLSKMGRTEKDLIPTRLTVTNFAGGITRTHGILDVEVIIGSKKLKIAFFVVDTTSTTYNALLGRDWIHQSLCVPSTLHQQLALWNEEGYMEIVEADPRPFLPSAMCFEARYYHDDLGPFTFLGVNQNGRPHGVTA